MKKKKLSRDEAKELYRDFQEAMKKMQTNQATKSAGSSEDVAKEIAMAIKEGMKRDGPSASRPSSTSETRAQPSSSSVQNMLTEPSISRAAQFASRFSSSRLLGTSAAFSAFVFLLLMKTGMVLIEMSGIAGTEVADASLQTIERTAFQNSNRFERAVLTKLDERRQELDERERRLEQDATKLNEQQRAFAARLVEMREITERLRQHREIDNRQQDAQLDQLANIYGSMNPTEAAALLEQLDSAIALELLGRMPGKRIGQILAIMSPERALTLTRMLSGRSER